MKEIFIVASRGRMKNGKWTQQFEPRDKICNTITCVTKDNLVLEVEMNNKDIKILGTIYPRETTFRETGYGAVYNENGSVNALTTMQGEEINQWQ